MKEKNLEKEGGDTFSKEKFKIPTDKTKEDEKTKNN